MESLVLNRLKLRCQSDLPVALAGVWVDVGFYHSGQGLAWTWAMCGAQIEGWEPGTGEGGSSPLSPQTQGLGSPQKC